MCNIGHVEMVGNRDLVASDCTKWAEWLDASRSLKRMMDLLTKHVVSAGYSGRKSFTLSFLKSPVEVLPDQAAPQRIRFQINRLEGPVDAARAVGTGEFVDVPCGLILRSIVYASTPLDGAPFDGCRKIIPNIAGRATDNGELVPRLYAAGWVKCGPVGVIATTMQDAYRTADAVIMDLVHAQGQSREAIDQMLSESG
ncbi:NADPH-adrenodoxin reductase [Coemansia sp. 'formosensis']|nr:NADPH-adrenodoxin reductase [Coemansia sp. 'formosensis']